MATTSPQREGSARLTVSLAVLAVVLAAHAPILFGAQTWGDAAQVTRSLPARAELAGALAEGRMPTWSDGVGLGVPFAADPDHAAFYPPQWLLAAAPAASTGLGDLLLLVHVWLAGLGAASVARRLGADDLGAAVAGVAFAAGGAMTSALPWGGAAFSTAALPWIVLTADGLAAAAGRRARLRASLQLGAVLALGVLGGDWLIAADGAILAAAVILLGGLRGRRVAGAGATDIASRAEIDPEPRRGVGKRAARAQASSGRGSQIVPRVVAAASPWLGWLALAVLVGLALAAVALLPGASFLARDSLGGGADATGAMSPARLLEWLAPGSLGSVRESGQSLLPGAAPWAASAYLGAPVLLFAALAARRGGSRHRLLAAVALGFTALALLGAARPALGGAAEQHLAAASLLLCALAGCGFTAAVAQPVDRRTGVLCIGAAVAMIAVALAALLAENHLAAHVLDALRTPGRGRLTTTVDPAAAGVAAAVHHAVMRGLLAALAFAAVVLAVLAVRRPRLRALAAPAAAAIIAVQLAGHATAALPRVPRATVDDVPVLLAPAVAAAADEPGTRPRLYRPLQLPRGVVAGDATAPPDTATRFGLAYVRGIAAGQDPLVDEIWRRAAIAGERLLDLYDVRYAIVPTSIAIPAGLPILARTGPSSDDLVLAENLARRPRAFVAERWRWHPDPAAAIAALFPDIPEPLRLGTVQLVGDAAEAAADPVPPQLAEDGASAALESQPCAVTSDRPDVVTLACNAIRDGWAVLLDADAPGWSATVDGEPTAIHRAEGLARAVRLAPGAHEVAFSYRAPGLALGAAISLAALAVTLIAWVMARRRAAA